jgi:ABC-type transport system involved in cytochrome c biogenesis ATPase subunit
LVSIGEIEGIDSLAPQEPLGFDGNLTTIYGHNGSGKSGYARILKRACGKHQTATLMTNVFKASPIRQRCTICYKIGNTEKTMRWDAQEPVEDLTFVNHAETVCIPMLQRVSAACTAVKLATQGEVDVLAQPDKVAIRALVEAIQAEAKE